VRPEPFSGVSRQNIRSEIMDGQPAFGNVGLVLAAHKGRLEN